MRMWKVTYQVKSAELDSKTMRQMIVMHMDQLGAGDMVENHVGNDLHKVWEVELISSGMYTL